MHAEFPNGVLMHGDCLEVLPGLSDRFDLVLDPMCGSGTTAAVANRLGRRWVAVDQSKAALDTARARLLKEES